MGVFENLKSNVRRVTLAGTENYLAVPRKEWVQQWPGMVVISGSQVYWTESIEQDIKEGRSLGAFTRLLIGRMSSAHWSTGLFSDWLQNIVNARRFPCWEIECSNKWYCRSRPRQIVLRYPDNPVRTDRYWRPCQGCHCWACENWNLRRKRFQLAITNAILYSSGQNGRDVRPSHQYRIQIRLWIFGQLRTLGHYPTHRQMLSNTNGCSKAQSWWCPRGTSWYW